MNSSGGNVNLSWGEDLAASRDVSDNDKQHYGFLLAWFESWRLRTGRAPSRAAAKEFWKLQVLANRRAKPAGPGGTGLIVSAASAHATALGHEAPFGA